MVVNLGPARGMVEGLGSMIPHGWEGAARWKKENTSLAEYMIVTIVQLSLMMLQKRSGPSVSTFSWDIANDLEILDLQNITMHTHFDPRKAYRALKERFAK